MYSKLNREYLEREDGYTNLRGILSEDYADLSDAQLENIIEPVLGDSSLEEYEGFLKDLSRFGQQAGNAISTAAPGAISGAMQGATAGAALGPYGILAGALGGAALGGYQSYQTSSKPRTLQTQSTQQQVPPSPLAASTPTMPVASHYQSGPSQIQGSQMATAPSGAASAQLLSVLTRPETLQALLSMIMAQTGRREIKVSGKQVPVAAFSNLISTLAQRSAAQQNTVAVNTAQSTPEYLMDEYGEFICDPMDSEQRADVLLSILNEDSNQHETDEYDYEDNEFYDDDDYLYAMDDEEEEEDIFWEDEVEALLAG